jgi:hypothetical protein
MRRKAAPKYEVTTEINSCSLHTSTSGMPKAKQQPTEFFLNGRTENLAKPCAERPVQKMLNFCSRMAVNDSLARKYICAMH